MSNTIYDTDFAEYLPEPLKRDEGIYALAKSLTAQLLSISGSSTETLIYDRIDEMPETLLDILAYDFHCDWYDADAPIDVKRATLKSNVVTHKHLGTKYAVLEVVTAAFGTGEVYEWFEYAGDPYHFKIRVDGSRITTFDPDYIRRMLHKVIPVRCVCDEIDFYLSAIFEIAEAFDDEKINIFFDNPIYRYDLLDGSQLLNGSQIMDACHDMPVDMNIKIEGGFKDIFEYIETIIYSVLFSQNVTQDIGMGMTATNEIAGNTQKTDIGISTTAQEPDTAQVYGLTTWKNYTLLNGDVLLDGADTMNAYKKEEVL